MLKLSEAYGPIRERELGLLREMKRKVVKRCGSDSANRSGEDGVSLNPWDVAYYTRAYKAECTGVDEAARPQGGLIAILHSIQCQ